MFICMNSLTSGISFSTCGEEGLTTSSTALGPGTGVGTGPLLLVCFLTGVAPKVENFIDYENHIYNIKYEKNMLLLKWAVLWLTKSSTFHTNIIIFLQGACIKPINKWIIKCSVILNCTWIYIYMSEDYLQPTNWRQIYKCGRCDIVCQTPV